MQKYGMSLMAIEVIQLIAVGFGIYKAVGFLSIMHEVWKDATAKKGASILALIGIVGEVMAVYFFPEHMWIIMPFSFAAVGQWLWVIVRFYRGLSTLPVKSREAYGLNLQERPLFSPVARLILTVIVVFFVFGNLTHSSNIIVETTNIATAKTDTLIRETKQARNDAATVKTELSAERDTSKKVREKLLAGQQKILSNLGVLNAQTKEPKIVYKPGKVQYVEVDTKSPIKSPLIRSQPSSLTPIIKNVEVEVKKKGEDKNFFQKMWPFSMNTIPKDNANYLIINELYGPGVTAKYLEPQEPNPEN